MDPYETALCQCAPDLNKLLNINAVQPYLLSKGMLTRDDSNTLSNSNKTPGDKIKFIIDMLPSKGRGWWDKFINSLKNSINGTAHGELAKTLEDTLEENLRMEGPMPPSSSSANHQQHHQQQSSQQMARGNKFSQENSGITPSQESTHMPIVHAESTDGPIKSQQTTNEVDVTSKLPVAKEKMQVEAPELDEESLKSKYENVKSNIKEKKGDVREELKGCNFLIQTVNDIEFYAVMNQMKDCEILQYDVLDPTCNSSSWYYVGYWGDARVAVVQTSMGAGGPGGSWYETRKAMYFMPDLCYTFLVGVCGGRIHKVLLGDVVVSKAIHGYADLKVTPGRFINRSDCLLNIDDNFYRYLTQTNNRQDNVKFGIVLSGPWLIADAEMQENLMQMCPEAKAFEMEGSGAARACKGKVGCLVVKGVCDLANKHKADDWQPQAATNAAQYLCKMINKGKHYLVQ